MESVWDVRRGWIVRRLQRVFSRAIMAIFWWILQATYAKFDKLIELRSDWKYEEDPFSGGIRREVASIIL